MKRKITRPFDPTRYVPAGISWQKELGKLGIWLGVCAVWGFMTFLMQYLPDQSDLMEWVEGERFLIPGSVMSDFHESMNLVLLLFPMACLYLVWTAVAYYQYHREGSMSIYLMRRLPDRWELHRRCLVFPFAGLVLCGIAAFLTVVLCYIYYMVATPEVCLTPGQWQKYWRFL